MNDWPQGWYRDETPPRRPGDAGGGWSDAPTGDLTNRYPAGSGSGGPGGSAGVRLAVPAAELFGSRAARIGRSAGELAVDPAPAVGAEADR